MKKDSVSLAWAPFLLSSTSPVLRLLVLRDLLGRKIDDPEVQELENLMDEEPLIRKLLEKQEKDGSWRTFESMPSPDPLRATSQALIRLGYLGLEPEHPAVNKAAEFLFSLQKSDGSWPIPAKTDEGERYSNYSYVPLQTAIPLRGLAACGYASDSRSEEAFEWLMERRLPDGAWPSGAADESYARVAGYRRLAHTRWGCRSNTTGVLICLALHPQRRYSTEARRALDLLLGRESKERQALGFEVARVIGVEQSRGLFTYYGRFDLAFVLELCWRIGASKDDPRVSSIVDFITQQQGPYGLWEYEPRPVASRWLTFDLLRSLSRLVKNEDWLTLEPPTPFSTYPKTQPRY